ncbi:hypothetical protein ACJX0J_007873, partial [Zea mays]
MWVLYTNTLFEKCQTTDFLIFLDGLGGVYSTISIGKILVLFGSIYFSLELYHLGMLGKNNICPFLFFQSLSKNNFSTIFLIFKFNKIGFMSFGFAADLKRYFQLTGKKR